MDIDDSERQQLEALSARFTSALDLVRGGRVDRAEDELRAIVRAEPRLPEPHMELGRLLLDSDRLNEAESHAREALSHLESSGPWTAELPPNVVAALAWALLAEILRRTADEDDVVFGDPDRFKDLVRESQEAFSKAATLDPSDEYASYHAFFLGAQGHGSNSH